VLFDWVSEGNRLLDAGERLGCTGFAELLWTVGLERLADQDEEGPDAEAERLLSEREAARAARDYATADARRDELAARGWEVRDTSQGPRLIRRA
jgi:cysteinyl-tRNA synthetase